MLSEILYFSSNYFTMRKKILLLTITCFSLASCFSQQNAVDSLKKVKDSTLRAAIHADSMKIEKQFAEQEKMLQLADKLQYPLIKAGEFSGVVPVKDPDEIPDPNQDYKLLFELTYNNPDSLSKEINAGLAEIIRVINLHIASRIPVKRIMPVIIIHGMALNAISNNQLYQKNYKTDNPNISVVQDLIQKAGAKFIACGQAMAFFDFKKENLLPEVKISLTAQTVLSNYQLKGYVLYKINEVN
jgi:intracellular sulfur oxidation DsrE/DsrF family protein